MIAAQFGRMLLALAFVLGLLWLCARVGKSSKSGKGKGGRRLGRMLGAPGGRIEVVSRRSLGRHTSIAVVKVAGKTMVVGQTPQQITVLDSVEDLPADEVADESADVRSRRSFTVEPDRIGMGDVEMVPGPAPEFGAETPKAWDAFIDSLREMTVRR